MLATTSRLSVAGRTPIKAPVSRAASSQSRASSRSGGHNFPAKLELRQGMKHRAGDVLPVHSAGSQRLQASASSDSSSSQISLGPVIKCVVIASMGAFCFGYHLGVVNGPLGVIAADLGFADNAGLQGAVVSTVLAGAAVGSLTAQSLADNLGRRKAFLLDSIPLFLGPLLSALAGSLTVMLAGRAITGFGIGLASALVPLYISEVSPTHVRGALGSVSQLVVCIGILAALVVNVALPATSWRTMFGLATIPAIVLALGFGSAAPESPRWLASKGKVAEATEASNKVWGASGRQQLSQGAESAIEGAKNAATKGPSMGEALQHKSVVISCLLLVFQQLSGINAIVYFSSSVFAKAGITSGALASAAVGAINVLGTVIAASLMDKAGRKQLLTTSFAGMGTAMLVMSIGLGLPQFASASGAIALVGTLTYVIFFALGAGPVPGILVPEITPAKLRGFALSAAMVTHWIFNFAIGQLFLPAVTNFGISKVYLFFTATCYATVIFARSQLIETKGRSLEEIEAAMAT